jgi:ribosomal protein S18 acetylase RimI-like enzyme
MAIKILKAKIKDIEGIVKVGSENFSGLKNMNAARKWVGCNFSAFPRTQYFIARRNGQPDGKISGYILWMEKGGFRKKSIWELEQIAVAKDCQGQGIGTQLIEKSLLEIKKYLEKRRSILRAIEVTTATDNRAQYLYKKTLGAEVECVIKNLFRGDEVIMVARFN